MFAVSIVGNLGVEAEFTVASPVVALDLALRATRAGFDWQARRRLHEGTGPWLDLDVLRELAHRHAGDETAEAAHLREVLEAERTAAAAGLN